MACKAKSGGKGMKKTNKPKSSSKTTASVRSPRRMPAQKKTARA